MNKKMLLASVVVGVAVTLISGLVQTPMAQLGIDVVYWGLPLPWTMRVIPTRFQSVDWLNLAADAVFWVIIASILAMSLAYLGTRRNMTHPIPPPNTK